MRVEKAYEEFSVGVSIDPPASDDDHTTPATDQSPADQEGTCESKESINSLSAIVLEGQVLNVWEKYVHYDIIRNGPSMPVEVVAKASAEVLFRLAGKDFGWWVGRLFFDENTLDDVNLVVSADGALSSKRDNAFKISSNVNNHLYSDFQLLCHPPPKFLSLLLLLRHRPMLYPIRHPVRQMFSTHMSIA